MDLWNDEHYVDLTAAEAVQKADAEFAEKRNAERIIKQIQKWSRERGFFVIEINVQGESGKTYGFRL